MSKTTRRRYTAEFKAEAVGLVTQQGYGVAAAARALGINRSLLDRWVRMERDRQDPEKAPQGRDAELEELREEVRKLMIEREILKNLRAAATAAVPPWGETPVRRCVEPRGLPTCSGRKQRPSAHWWLDPVKKTWSRDCCGPGIGDTTS